MYSLLRTRSRRLVLVFGVSALLAGLCTTAPAKNALQFQIQNLQATPESFTPQQNNTILRADVVSTGFTPRNLTWTLTIHDKKGRTFRTVRGGSKKIKFVWNGRDHGGQYVPVADYKWDIIATCDEMGTTHASSKVTVDPVVPYIVEITGPGIDYHRGKPSHRTPVTIPISGSIHPMPNPNPGSRTAVRSAPAQGSDNHKVSPIFDGNDGIPGLTLELEWSYARDHDPNPAAYPVRHTYYDEAWGSVKSKDPGKEKLARIIEIRRWRLPSADEAIEFPRRSSVFGEFPWPGWSLVPDIGDRTYWYGSRDVSFVKENWFVRIRVHSAMGKEYTAKIARIILKKL